MWKRWIKSTLWLWVFSGQYCAHCVLLRTLFPAQLTFPTALLVSHSRPEKGWAQVLPLPSPVPVHSPAGGISLLLKNWLWLQLCPFRAGSSAMSTVYRHLSERGMLKLVCCIRGSSIRGKLPLLCVWCLWWAASTRRCGLRWASVSQMAPGRPWLQLWDILEWLWPFFHQLLADKRKEMLIQVKMK